MTENEILVKELKETADVLYHAEFYKQASIVNQAANTLESFSAYEKIGTVEEYMEIMEKGTARKPIRIDMCTCPKCGTYNETVKKRRNTVPYDIVYCWHCGQAMEVEAEV